MKYEIKITKPSKPGKWSVEYKNGTANSETLSKTMALIGHMIALDLGVEEDYSHAIGLRKQKEKRNCK